MDSGLQAHELVLLILGLGGLFLLAGIWEEFRAIPDRGLLAFALFSLVLSWICTNAEHLIWPGFFNVGDHLGYLLCVIFVIVWCLRVIRTHREHEP